MRQPLWRSDWKCVNSYHSLSWKWSAKNTPTHSPKISIFKKLSSWLTAPIQIRGGFQLAPNTCFWADFPFLLHPSMHLQFQPIWLSLVLIAQQNSQSDSCWKFQDSQVTKQGRPTTNLLPTPFSFHTSISLPFGLSWQRFSLHHREKLLLPP